MTDSQNGAFEMLGARALVAQLGGADNIERYISATEKAVFEDPGLAIDLAKSIVECTCKTIMEKRGSQPPGACDLQKLVKDTLNLLSLAPGGYKKAKELREGLTKAVSGLLTAVQGLGEVRNIEGSASHGKESSWMAIGPPQAQFAARAADAVVYFLLLAHLGQAAKPMSHKPRLEDNPDFNAYLDEANGMLFVQDYAYDASEVLFYVDEEAYKTELGKYTAEQELALSGEEAEEEIESDIDGFVTEGSK